MIVPKSYQRFLTAALSTVTRCPTTNCAGELRFTVAGPRVSVQDPEPRCSGVCGGYVGDYIAMYKCQTCGIHFEVLNPRSFGPQPKAFGEPEGLPELVKTSERQR